MSFVFESSAKDRLKEYLLKNNQQVNFEQLTPDASTREYFRIYDNFNNTKIACIYQEKLDNDLPQLDVTNLFLKSNLPVADIFDVDFDLGIVIHEDFGNNILRDVLENADDIKSKKLLDDAIVLIAKIQSATPKAFELDSIASKLKFDEAKLVWELEFFKNHYFESYLGDPLPIIDNETLVNEFIELSKELEKFASVLTHRDFHTANLMVSDENKLKIIDHQDARLGSTAYDLVSLLLDRIIKIPTQVRLKEKKLFFLSEREKLKLPHIEYDDFNYEFELMTIQRCLKAIGTFSNQAGNLGKQQYIVYINPMFKVVLEACQRLQRFPNLQRLINDQI